MSDITYTEEELSEFNACSWRLDSRDQVERISARLEMRRLVDQHGKPKCDAMWAEIMSREEKNARPVAGARKTG